MFSYLFQATLAALLVFGATVGVTKFVLEATHRPVLSDQERDIELAKRSAEDTDAVA
jgi:hypothetical protein